MKHIQRDYKVKMYIPRESANQNVVNVGERNDDVVLKRQCQQSAQVLDRIPTTGDKDTKMQKDPNVVPQASQTPSAKTRLTMSSRERQPMTRCQTCVKHE